ncbi:MAG: hypothetical protein LBC61_06620 [Candidatus Peribacteria bacterium]|nr:hypothetical protein [Candidatus Peribacteria bacterium]
MSNISIFPVFKLNISAFKKLPSHSNQKHQAFQTIKAQIVQGSHINLSQILVKYSFCKVKAIHETNSQELAFKNLVFSSYSQPL